MLSLIIPFLFSGLIVVQARDGLGKNGDNELLTKAHGSYEEKNDAINELRKRQQQQDAKIDTLMSAIDEMKRIQNQKDETIHKIQLDQDNLRFENSQQEAKIDTLMGVIDEMKLIQNQKDETIHIIKLGLDNLRFENSQLKQNFSKCAGQIQSISVALQHLEKTNKGYEPLKKENTMKTFEAGANALLEDEATNNETRSQSGCFGKISLMSTDESKREEAKQHNDAYCTEHLTEQQEGEDAVKQTVSGHHAGTDLVAFFATLSRTAEHLGVYQNVLFDNIITNVGSGYSQHLGSFIAPVSGVYVFMTTLMSQFGFDSYFEFVRNGHGVCKMYLGGSDGENYGTSAGSFVLQLSKGDVVAIQNLLSSGDLIGYDYSYFSGFLLKAI